MQRYSQFIGVYNMKSVILTEQSNEDTKNIDLMTSFEIARAINNEDKKVAFAVEKELDRIGKGIDIISSAFIPTS